MDSMPRRSRRHQPLSLLGLPQDIHIEIVARVGTTSERPLDDLRSLRGTCSTMRRVCGHDDVGRRLSIERIWDEISLVWVPPLTKHSMLCWPVSGMRRFASSPRSTPSSSKIGDRMISGTPLRVSTMRRPIYMPSCSTETMAVLPQTTPRSGT
jgi:hypothetical protein